MIDLKYHIYSLVAVFLALAVGMLIGASMGGGLTGSEAIGKQSEAIERLNKQFRAHQDTLAEKQSALDDMARDLKQADALSVRLLQPLLQNALAGRGVALVQLGQGDEVATAVRAALQLAGAAVNSTTRIDTQFGFGDPEQMKKASGALPIEFQSSGKEPYQQFWGYISTVLSSGRADAPFDKLASAGVLQVEGDLSRPNRFVVVIMPKGEDAVALKDTILTPLLDRLKAADLSPVVAAAQASSSATPEEYWQQLDVPTVSHADMTFGQISLVEALAKEEGHYGLGPSEELLPARLTTR